MSDLALMARLPEVKSAVLGDLAGAFLDAVREPDGETVAAEMGFVASAMVEAGEHLGLGPLRTIALAGATRSSMVVVRRGAVISALVDPPRALAAVEKAVETSFQSWD